MNSNMRLVVWVLVIGMLSPVALARGGRGNGPGGRSGGGGTQAVLEGLPYQELSPEEIANLLYMREEEKLARDVYLTLDDRWGLRVFRNIASSEQRHMNAIATLLEKYSLADPVGSNGIGIFTDQELQALYHQLVTQGEQSLITALTVGATIEDLDIKDLLDALDQTDNEDVAMAFQNLMKGSRNHLRAFYDLLAANGADYEPQYLSQSLFDQIVTSAKENGRVDHEGLPVSGGRGRSSSGQGRGRR